MRASDAEREAVVERLREASVDGRLTLSELTERTEAAYLAVTHAELAQITADLPGGTATAAAPGPHPAPARPPGRARRWYVAVMGDTKRRGKWRVDQEIGAVAVMGDVTIDLREAEVRSNEIDIVATAVMGDVKIIVPDGVDVDLSGMAIMGDKRADVVEAPPGQQVPVVRVRAYAVMGDVKVIGDSRAKPIRRSLAAWTDWWLERRGAMYGDHLGSLRGLGEEVHRAHDDAHRHHREALHDAHRYQREALDDARRFQREAMRQTRDAIRQVRRDVRRGDPPPPPPAPPYA
ncbi:hypothetical protein Sme01_08260 [Sphaerisporangium melleum]|uniref:Cell wall-active antibiotics response LiaF-like C-terminal domain-containing protein n=2 Tax=Sphaerisporangium melleum TaxID=321316 RepID=A0A917QWR4_9ACTN|nr:hypothetical protein GCM10007964_13930 [Sphaerisporangium melleum]GII68350.1 hypothetical protein Sme01_08260 [Sphaerisporangium melleum]